MSILLFCASTCFQFWLKDVAQIILYYHVTKQFLPCLNWLVKCFRFQNIFRKTLIAFDFDEKPSQSVAQYNVSKNLLGLHFAVGQVLSSSGYDLKSGRMPCKQKYCIKNMAVKIPILILFCFFYFAGLKTIYFVSCLCCSCKLFWLYRPL